MSSADNDGNSVLPETLSSNMSLAAKFSEFSRKSLYASIFNSENGTYTEKAAENEPFYVVETTFSKALSTRIQGPKESASTDRNALKVQTDHPVYKIYDSLNIEIYEQVP
jgi:hypothetical protein